MPNKRARAKGVDVDVGEVELHCEWSDCHQVFSTMETLINHMTSHISEYYSTCNGHVTGIFECQWRDCGSQVSGHTTDFNRHVYFHAFHVKIKNVGAAVVEKHQLTPCQMDSQSRNLIPELPERLHCGWNSCEMVYDNPEYFYLHMDMHALNFPDGNHVPGGCRCQWEGCDTTVKSKYKLREHLRSHTQEKMIACPVCGALFANRAKFMDHLRRQGAADVQCYECSHCNKRFTSERLLREHMRHHVNHYKCPYCDMTCPSPSGLRNHLLYRHTEDRPFKCDQCDYSCKSSSDLRKHMETHTAMKTFQCHVSGCDFRVRSYQALSHHFTKEHQGLEAARYACHVCNSVFSRGHHLTIHLKRKHKFKWPSGHCRFRYKPSEDGFLRLQTVRYESVELMDQITNLPSTASSNHGQNQENVAPTQNETVSPHHEQDSHGSESAENSSTSHTVIYKPSEEIASDNMAYNLEMLGDVALHGPANTAMTTQDFRQILPKTSEPSTSSVEQGTSEILSAGMSNYRTILPKPTAVSSMGQDTGRHVLAGTVQTVPSVYVSETSEDGDMVTMEMFALSNVPATTLDHGVTEFCLRDDRPADQRHLAGFAEAPAQTYIVCSSGTDSELETLKSGSGGAETDILRLQQTAAEYGINVVDSC